MAENNVFNYEVNEKGQRVLDKASSVQRIINYLGPKLYPFELSGKSLNALSKILEKDIEQFKVPKIIVCKEDYQRSVFGTLFMLINKIFEHNEYLTHDVVDITHSTQNYLDGEYHDVSAEYDGVKVLFVRLNFNDMPNYINAYSIRNLAMSRKEKGLYTFFYFFGNKTELLSDKWKIDEFGDGKRGIILDEDNKVVNDTRTLIPLTRYISYYDLNVKLGGLKK